MPRLFRYVCRALLAVFSDSDFFGSTYQDISDVDRALLAVFSGSDFLGSTCQDNSDMYAGLC